MNRIEREKMVIAQMITIYCRNHHKDVSQPLCEECRELLNYAKARLTHCPKGNGKSSCKKCESHCYRPEMRESIRKVMRYVGPRMIFYHPIAAIRHLFAELK